MAVIDVALGVIDDNPYNPRKYYAQAKVKEMAQSLREVGLRQVPEGRHVDGRVQLAYGHMRKKGYLANQKNDPEHWKMMPVDVKEISDPDMFHFAMEENLRRTDISQIELARCILAFSEMFPEVTEKAIGQKHGMSEASVSNMKRVLRLPEKMLERIDEGIISFHQGRDLLIFERFENAENLMRSALDGLKTVNKPYGEPNTVDGLQKSIHSTIKGQCRPLDKEWEGFRRDLLFDTRAAGCLECEKMIRTHPNKSATAHWCTDEPCWQAKQTEHREQAAAAAKAKMEAEVISRAAQVIAEEEKAPEPAPVMIDENTICIDQETFEKIAASCSADRISEGTAVRKPVQFKGKLYLAIGSSMGKVETYQLVPREEFTSEVRTYKVPAGREYEEYYDSLRSDPNGFYHGMLVKRGKEDNILVGPEVTFVTKVDQGDFSREKFEPALPQYTLEKRGSSWIALDAQGVVIAIDRTKEKANAGAVAYFSPVPTTINPDYGDYVLNHTYRFVEKPGSRKLEYFDVTAQDLTAAAKALGVDVENIELVKVWKSSGKAGTAGSVSAGWSKCTETLPAEIEKLEEPAEAVRELPCDTCAKGQTCDRSFFHIADDDSGRLVCEQWECDHVSWATSPDEEPPDETCSTEEELRQMERDATEQELSRRIAAAPAPQEIPEDILAMARVKSGTRAEVLDLNDISTGEGYSRQVKSGYTILDGEFRFFEDSAECLERCTHGFHYAFDSKAKEQREIRVCSDPKCLGQKKSAFTRKNNAAGQARKNAEKKAVKEAIAQTVTLDRPRMKLILLAQMDGLHASRTYYYGVESSTKKPEKWLWDKLSAGTPENDRTRAKLFKAIDKLTDEELAQLVVAFMIYYLVDHGDIGSYEIKVEEPLKWMGVDIKVEAV